MADNDKLPQQIVDALKDIEEITGVNVQKTAAKVVRSAYTAQVAAISLTIPLIVGGPASLSQEQTRRPDENLPTQNQGTPEPMRSLMVATTSAADSLSFSGVESESVYIFEDVYLEEYEGSKLADSPKSQSTVEGSLDKAPTEP